MGAVEVDAGLSVVDRQLRHGEDAALSPSIALCLWDAEKLSKNLGGEALPSSAEGRCKASSAIVAHAEDLLPLLSCAYSSAICIIQGSGLTARALARLQLVALSSGLSLQVIQASSAAAVLPSVLSGLLNPPGSGHHWPSNSGIVAGLGEKELPEEAFLCGLGCLNPLSCAALLDSTRESGLAGLLEMIASSFNPETPGGGQKTDGNGCSIPDVPFHCLVLLARQLNRSLSDDESPASSSRWGAGRAAGFPPHRAAAAAAVAKVALKQSQHLVDHQGQQLQPLHQLHDILSNPEGSNMARMSGQPSQGLTAGCSFQRDLQTALPCSVETPSMKEEGGMSPWSWWGDEVLGGGSTAVGATWSKTQHPGAMSATLYHINPPGTHPEQTRSPEFHHAHHRRLWMEADGRPENSGVDLSWGGGGFRRGSSAPSGSCSLGSRSSSSMMAVTESSAEGAFNIGGTDNLRLVAMGDGDRLGQWDREEQAKAVVGPSDGACYDFGVQGGGLWRQEGLRGREEVEDRTGLWGRDEFGVGEPDLDLSFILEPEEMDDSMGHLILGADQSEAALRAGCLEAVSRSRGAAIQPVAYPELSGARGRDEMHRKRDRHGMGHHQLSHGEGGAEERAEAKKRWGGRRSNSSAQRAINAGRQLISTASLGPSLRAFVTSLEVMSNFCCCIQVAKAREGLRTLGV